MKEMYSLCIWYRNAGSPETLLTPVTSRVNEEIRNAMRSGQVKKILVELCKVKD